MNLLHEFKAMQAPNQIDEEIKSPVVKNLDQDVFSQMQQNTSEVPGSST